MKERKRERKRKIKEKLSEKAKKERKRERKKKERKKEKACITYSLNTSFPPVLPIIFSIRSVFEIMIFPFWLRFEKLLFLVLM